ncbi:glycerophosphodiester phosphodiesterase [Calditrichota bacterium LG25]
MNESKPLIISHRGAKNLAPENTIKACELALEHGASALEVDLRMCGSGEIVLFHDYWLWRHFRKIKAVRKSPLKELKQLRFNHIIYQYQDNICTLTEFLAHFKNTVPINLDIKNLFTNNLQLIRAIVHEVKQHEMQDQIWLSSFSPNFLRVIKKEFPEIRTGYLFRNFSLVHRYIDKIVKADAWHPHYRLVSERFLQISRRLKKEVYIWTIKDEPIFKKMVNQHFNGIITDVLIK